MTFEEAIQKALKFREERDWEQFHNSKDLAISISLEAAELLENFQWSGSDLEATDKKAQIEDELADVLIYCIYLAKQQEIDMPEAIASKIESNAKKYPIDKSKGNSKKYTKL